MGVLGLWVLDCTPWPDGASRPSSSRREMTTVADPVVKTREFAPGEGPATSQNGCEELACSDGMVIVRSPAKRTDCDPVRLKVSNGPGVTSRGPSTTWALHALSGRRRVDA